MRLRDWGPFSFCSLVVDYIPNPDLSSSTLWKDKEEGKKKTINKNVERKPHYSVERQNNFN